MTNFQKEKIKKEWVRGTWSDGQSLKPTHLMPIGKPEWTGENLQALPLPILSLSPLLSTHLAATVYASHLTGHPPRSKGIKGTPCIPTYSQRSDRYHLLGPKAETRPWLGHFPLALGFFPLGSWWGSCYGLLLSNYFQTIMVRNELTNLAQKSSKKSYLFSYTIAWVHLRICMSF